MTASIHHFPVHHEAITTARAVLRSPDIYPIEVVDDACMALECWSRDPMDRTMAREVRRGMGIRAAAEVNAEIYALLGNPAPRSRFTLDSLLYAGSAWLVGFVACFWIGTMIGRAVFGSW